jgi:hypothetical protein
MENLVVRKGKVWGGVEESLGWIVKREDQVMECGIEVKRGAYKSYQEQKEAW